MARIKRFRASRQAIEDVPETSLRVSEVLVDLIAAGHSFTRWEDHMKDFFAFEIHYDRPFP